MNEQAESPRRAALMLQVGAIVIAYFGLFGALLYAIHQVSGHGA